MTIEVVKRGDDPKHQVFTGLCHACHSELRWRMSDHVEPPWDSHGQPSRYTRVVCPVCSGWVHSSEVRVKS